MGNINKKRKHLSLSIEPKVSLLKKLDSCVSMRRLTSFVYSMFTCAKILLKISKRTDTPMGNINNKKRKHLSLSMKPKVSLLKKQLEVV